MADTTLPPSTQANDPHYVTPGEARSAVAKLSYGELSMAVWRTRNRVVHCATNYDRAVLDEAMRILRVLDQL